MKYFWKIVFVTVIAILWTTYNHPEWIVAPQFPKVSATGLNPCSDNNYLQGYGKDSGTPVCKPDNLTDPAESKQPQTSNSDTIQSFNNFDGK